MKKKQFGSTDLAVSTLCFGGNVFGWTADPAMSHRLLDAFMEAGGNFVDTANTYRRKQPDQEEFASEVIIGHWMKDRGNRRQVVLATKVGSVMAPDQKGLAKNYILKEVEESLRRLQTDYFDLYISHRPDATVPIEETLEAYDQLVRQGKVRYIGASNYRGPALAEAAEASRNKNLPAYRSLQPFYNLYDRQDFEENLQKTCEDLGLAVTPYFALAAGFLTGKYRSEADFSKSPRGANMAKYLNDRGFRILQALDQVALESKSTPATVALAWLMQRPVVTSSIASATSLEQMRGLVEATELKLGSDAIKALDSASAWA